MYTVLLIRHAEAEERAAAEAAGTPDAARALTDKGRKTMARVAASLAALVPDLAVIASSPLVRAVQTAEILAQSHRKLPLIRSDSLAPGGAPDAVARFISSLERHGPCALVGHEPDLGLFASWSLGGMERSFIPFKKAGAALLHFPGECAAGGAELQWLLTAGQLRRLKHD